MQKQKIWIYYNFPRKCEEVCLCKAFRFEIVFMTEAVTAENSLMGNEEKHTLWPTACHENNRRM